MWKIKEGVRSLSTADSEWSFKRLLTIQDLPDISVLIAKVLDMANFVNDQRSANSVEDESNQEECWIVYYLVFGNREDSETGSLESWVGKDWSSQGEGNTNRIG